MTHPQGQCPPPVRRVRIVGDQSRGAYSLCEACIASYERAPFSFTFASADEPEWVIRARESRLPGRVAA